MYEINARLIKVCKANKYDQNMMRDYCALRLEEALRRERDSLLGEDGEEGGEREEGEAEADAGDESGETERLLVGLLLGEPRGEE